MDKSNSEFKIEKNVPIPKMAGGARKKYPWAEMEVGDSFFVPGKSPDNISGASAMGRKLGRKFAMRTVDGGVRIWRVE